jgi:AraC family transcriptional regulator, transcriptional activator of pobA
MINSVSSNNQSDKSEINTLSEFIILELSALDIIHKNVILKEKWNSLLYIKGGNCVLQIDFDEYIALENRIFFIEKYKIWNWARINKLSVILVQFTDSFYNHIYTGNPKLKSDQTLLGEIPPFIKIDTGNKAEWGNIFNIIFNEYLYAKKDSKEIICLALKILILMYRRNSRSGNKLFVSNQKKQLLNEFRKIVNSRFISLRTSKDYAQVLNITPNYLNALCREYFFKTAGEIIQERVILEAKRMLMHSSLSISEISYKLGFNDNSYFGRYFKNVVGMTPKSFRSIWFE